jgi:hypothetical protein
MAKYDALAAFLAELPRDQSEIELTFGRIDGLVGGLPPSARRLRTWWANNSQGQSLAWHRSGWHVRSVDLAGRTVAFARGQVGGSYAARGRSSATSRGAIDHPVESAPKSFGPGAAPLASTETVDARVTFDWTRLGRLALDSGGKLAFPTPLAASPGLYRFTLVNRTGRSSIYIGESDNVRRRLNTNYRNPGPRQQTSLRLNTLLVEHLRAGFDVEVDVASAATLHVPGSPSTDLDLSRKAGRLLAESAALVLAQSSDHADIANMG